jgi:hypothetical protein
VLVSDIENGLYVLGATYIRGCYLEGTVTDLITSNPINNASVVILTTTISTTTDLTGDYATGTVNSGTYDVVYSAPGYISDTISTTLSNGVLTIVDVQLSMPPFYTLTIESVAGGTTNPSPGSHIYDTGTEVTIKAIPNSGYRFSNWSGDASGTSNPITITMNSDKSIKANFSAIPPSEEAGKKGGCFIATAAYGSPLHLHLDILRDFRDKYLMPSELGRSLVNLYYKYSPFFADLIAKNKALKVTVQINLLPFVALSYSMLHFGWVITAAILAFISIVPIFLILLSRRRFRQTRA